MLSDPNPNSVNSDGRYLVDDLEPGVAAYNLEPVVH